MYQFKPGTTKLSVLALTKGYTPRFTNPNEHTVPWICGQALCN